MRKRIALTLAAFALIATACAASPPKSEDIQLIIVNIGDRAVTCAFFSTGEGWTSGGVAMSCDWGDG